ncbi:MAG TPA: type 1 glutamine amidotransferase [Thermodesulfobacteriota bacterium]|nr:type 1 glutamine amidotransferase [Thermodesulfobacteriota bacterium]
MNVLIVKHVEVEGPGLIEDCLKKGNFPHQLLSLESDVHFPKLDDLTHIVLLGGPMNVYEEDRYPFLKYEDLFIKEAIQRGKRILGICLGAQLIAKALGAKVYKAPVKEIGWYDLSLTEEGVRDPLFSPFPKTFPVFQWHGDTFDLPNAAKLIATSSPVQNQAFRYGENAYGLQFHIEVTEEMIQEWMKDYEKEFEVSKSFHVSKQEILKETEKRWADYSNHGIIFISRFLDFQPH